MTAGALGGLAVVEVSMAAVLAVAAGMSFHSALDAFVVTNGLMGLSFAVSGLLVAWHRPGNPIGWLFLADGLGHAASAWLVPLAQVIHDQHGSVLLQRVASSLSTYSWPWSIALFLPVALLLFPDGRPASPQWRPVIALVVLTAPLFVIESGLDPQPVSPGLPAGYFTVSWFDRLTPLWTISEIRTGLSLVLAMVSLVVRYRRAPEVERRQLLWLLLASIGVVAVVFPWSFVAGTPVGVLFAIPLVPLAVTIAIVRHQLLDIRLIVSRALAWSLLSLAVLLAYVSLVAVLGTVVSQVFGRSVLATVLVAVGLAPVLPRLQHAVDRWMYGDRRDPARLASRVSEHLVTGDERGLFGVVAGLRVALRLPYVAVACDGSTLAEDGQRPESMTALPLEYGGESVGHLQIGLRAGERKLTTADHGALQLVAGPIAVAVRALKLSSDLQVSRERIVLGREEERRRLRRDLHDGLGPTLTGVAFAADAAANLLDLEPARARTLIQSLCQDTRTALSDVRRLVDDLRPSALDELGLLGAIRQRADQLSWRPDGTAIDVRLDVPLRLPTLPAAVEVAAYRIATEALTNVARHAGASGAVLQLRCATTLDLEVTDDGGRAVSWSPGVGLQTMRERAAEVGARFEAGPAHGGGRVFVSIPLVAV